MIPTEWLHPGLFINGEFRPAVSGQRFSVENPSDGSALGSVPDGSGADTDLAIDAAAAAFASWSKMPAGERAGRLRRLYDLIMAHQEELACLLTSEQGKPLAEARGEIAIGAEYVLWYAEEARRVYGMTIPHNSADKRILVLKQPIGVVGAITPWNFPFSMVTRKAAPALASGCTVVLKPAEQTPLTALAFAALVQAAGFPPGTFNLVTGRDPAAIGQRLLNDVRVRKISFTGSTAVGKRLMAGAADQVKKLSLELGGHAPFLVFADADLEQAVKGVVASKFRNAGQTCICTNRLLVHESIAADFQALLAEQVTKLKVGPGLDPRAEVGPLIDQRAFDKVQDHIQDALAHGARLLCGGSRANEGPGHFFQPTVLMNASPSMKVMSEETFGPVLPVMTFTDDNEAVAIANNTPYGLAAYAYTRDLGRAMRVAEALEYGIVGLNDGVPTVVQAPFGGIKESGIGREGGMWGLESFLETKYVSLGL